MFMHKTLAFLASRVLMVIGGPARAALFDENLEKSSDGTDDRDRKNSRGPLLPHHRAYRSLTQRPGRLSQRV